MWCESEVVRLLNFYFVPVVEEVTASGGVVDKFIGDAVLAVWGALEPVDDYADRAIAAAINKGWIPFWRAAKGLQIWSIKIPEGINGPFTLDDALDQADPNPDALVRVQGDPEWRALRDFAPRIILTHHRQYARYAPRPPRDPPRRSRKRRSRLRGRSHRIGGDGRRASRRHSRRRRWLG